MTISSLFTGTLTVRGREIKKSVLWILSSSVVLVVLLVSLTVSAYHKQTSKPIAIQPSPTLTTPTPTPTPAPTTAADHLNGLLVPVGSENKQPLAVMIENDPAARPQSGLGSADVVYEAIAEGGITRFMAVFANAQTPVRVGPVRSARPYFVDWATELNAFYAHAGGSADAMQQISSTNVYNIDGLSIGAPLFQRDYSRPVALEHTLYSSTDSLWNYATGTKHWPTTDSYQPWLFTDDAAVSARPAAQTVNVSVSSALFAVSWKYDPATNSYLRSMAGTPHIDANTGKQISAKTIILQTVSSSTYDEHYSGGITKTVSHLNDTGSGPVTVVEDGVSITGTWKKNGTGRTLFYDASGKEINFVRGAIWVEIVQPDSKVSVQ